MNNIKRIIQKLLTDFNAKIIILIITSLVTTLTTAPLVYCSFFNYATGDDLHYSNLTHLVVVNHGTLREFFSGMIERFYSFYYGWGGNWSAALMWTLQPSIWGEKYYHITFYISALFIFSGIGYLSYYWYKKYVGTDKIYFTILFLLLSIICTQGMPNGNTAFFWYSVYTNYIIPFGLMLGVVVWFDKYIETSTVSSKLIYIILSSLSLIYIGGAGYMTLVVSLVILVLFLFYVLVIKKAYKQLILMMIPFISFLVSTIYNIKAPGNIARGGDALELSISKIIFVIGKSILRGITNTGHYFMYCRLLFIYVPLLILISCYAIDISRFTVKYLWIKIGIGFLIYCSSFAPMVMMNDITASSGHTNTYWMLFVLWISYSVIAVTGVIKKQLLNKQETNNLNILLNIYKIACVTLVMLSLIMYKHFIGNMYGYKCYDFIASGQLADFEAQMQERFELLNDPNVTDVVVPYMNSEQGPFIHFAITNDVTNYSNEVTAAFYGKNTVLGIPREEYYEIIKQK